MSVFNKIYQSQYPALLESILPVDLPPLSAGDDKQQGSRSLPNVTSYPSRNYLAPLLVLTERANGGVGLAFRGFIPFTDEEGNDKHVRIVAKLVQPGEDELALVHEAKVYRSLQEADVHGIPCMIGVFHDIDDDLYVLVTTDMGRSFADAAPVASPSNRCACLLLFAIYSRPNLSSVTTYGKHCPQFTTAAGYMVIFALRTSLKTPPPVFQSLILIVLNPMITRTPCQPLKSLRTPWYCLKESQQMTRATVTHSNMPHFIQKTFLVCD
jgi:hypothetical protein